MAPTQSVFMPVETALAQMITQLQQSGSKISDFSTGSGARSIFEAAAIVWSSNSSTADQLQRDAYLDTATGDALDALGLNNWMVARKPSVQAAGEITITRQSTSGALTIPAGWGQLATSPSVPGQLGVAVVTTQDADFATGVATAAVTAQAVLGGASGDLTVSTLLTPMSPINTVDSQTGYEVTTAFTGGVDAETDDAYRARIPVAVQGRVLGRDTSFLAAALSVPGVLSANVLGPGATRGDSTTVGTGIIEVYFQGSTGLLTAVTSAVDNAATFGQTPSAFAAVSLTGARGAQVVDVTVTVYCQPGTDPTALAAAVQAALVAYVNATGVGNNVDYSGVVEAVLAVPGVVSVGLPLTKLCISGGSGAADITINGDAYASLITSNVNVTVNTL